MTLPFQTHVNLKAYNTMALDVSAERFFPLTTKVQLTKLFLSNAFKSPFFILGGGSNILFTQNYPGLIIHNLLKGIEILEENERCVLIKAAAGENWHEFVMFCVEQGFGGLENLSLIPGTIGAAPIQNIGAYGVELKDYFHSLDAFSIRTGETLTFSKKDCKFAYRESIFKSELKNQYLIESVTFKLNKFPTLNFSYGAIKETLHTMEFSKLSIKVISDAIIKIRQEKLPDPKILPNTGSFFKNPFINANHYQELLQIYPNMPCYQTSESEFVKVPAGWLIEQAGFKGKHFGNVGVYEKQALVLVNYNDGSSEEILALKNKIQHTIKNKFNINLETEVQLI